MKIYLTRHGQTDWNVEHRPQGKADIELNRKGEEQARIVAKEKLNNTYIDLIICSPLKRAKRTAEIINTDRNIPIIYDERISERDFGEFEGKTIDEIKNETKFQGFWNYEYNIQYKKAENIQKFFNRVYEFLDETKEKYRDKNILLVAHGGVSVPVICYFKGIPKEENLIKMGIKNCEVKEFEIKA